MHFRSVFAWMLFACFAFSSSAQAAWPDSSPGRIEAARVLRIDFITPVSLLEGEERLKMYKKACGMEKKYSAICKYESWTTPGGQADLKAVGEIFSKRCKSEPLSCVVSGWSNGFVKGVPSKLAPNYKKAFKDLTFGCEKKVYAPSCAHLGELYMEGVGAKRSAKKAMSLYKEACKAKDPYGCMNIGRLLLRGGKGLKTNYPEAKKRLDAACSQGYSQGCTELGSMYEKGLGSQKDLKMALKLYDKGCKSKNGLACYNLARLNLAGGKNTTGIAFGLFSTLCAKGEKRSCYELGQLYENGRTVKKDLKQAIGFYDQACNLNHSMACGKLGVMLVNEKNVFANPKKGVKLLNIGCDGGDPVACVTFAELLEAGKHMKKDVKRAVKLYKTSCENEQGFGCRKLGQIYDVGKLVKKSHKKATKYYRMGCDNLNDAESCGAIGERFLLGKSGVLKNSKEALRYLSRGCDLGHDRSCAHLGDFYAEGKLVKQDYPKALKMYEIACKIDDMQACYKGGKLIVDDKVPGANFYRALTNLEKACKADVVEACDASKPIIFQARFEGIVANAFHPKDCEVWTLNEDRPDKNKNVVLVNGKKFMVKRGKHQGKTFDAKLIDTKYKKTKKKKIAQSNWMLTSGSTKLKIEHHENWNFVRNPNPSKSFPGPESFSKDAKKYGGRSIYYSREQEYLARNVYKFCNFFGNVKMLTAEHCTEVQALIAAQLVSSCKTNP